MGDRDRSEQEETLQTLIEAALGEESSEEDEEEFPADMVLYLVVVMVGEDGKRQAGAVLYPECNNDLEERLRAQITQEWLDTAPVGVYSYRYDYDAMVEATDESDGDQHFLFYRGPEDEAQHGHKLGSFIARELITAGVGLYNAFASLPDEEELLEQFDTAVNTTIARTAEVNIARYKPGAIQWLITSKSQKDQQIGELRKQGASTIIYIELPEPTFAFHTHMKEVVGRYLDGLFTGREEIVVRARVRQLLRERGKASTNKRIRARIDDQIDHLCVVFGIDEETATHQTSWNLGIANPEELEDPPFVIPGLMPEA